MYFHWCVLLIFAVCWKNNEMPIANIMMKMMIKNNLISHNDRFFQFKFSMSWFLKSPFSKIEIASWLFRISTSSFVSDYCNLHIVYDFSSLSQSISVISETPHDLKFNKKQEGKKSLIICVVVHDSSFIGPLHGMCVIHFLSNISASWNWIGKLRIICWSKLALWIWWIWNSLILLFWIWWRKYYV